MTQKLGRTGPIAQDSQQIKLAFTGVVADLKYDLRTTNGKERIIVVVPLNVKLHIEILKRTLFVGCN